MKYFFFATELNLYCSSTVINISILARDSQRVIIKFFKNIKKKY
jgi:hypothetical protein